MSAVAISDLVTHDGFGRQCVEEADLDAAFMLGGKGGPVPPTCLPTDAARTPEALAESLGHWPTPDEWAAYSYVWFRTNDPERVLFVDMGPIKPTEPLIPPVPLPSSGALLAVLVLATLAHSLTQKRRNP